MEFKIKTDDKPALDTLLKEDRKKAQEVIGTFVELMEEAIQNKWHELPQLFGQGKVSMTFRDIVKGILHGSLDLPDIHPDAYPVLKEEVHPLSMVAPRKNTLTGGQRYLDWRDWYKMDPPVTQEKISQFIRKTLRYYRYVNIDKLAEAVINNQELTFRGLGERNVATLPFMPALRYQKALTNNDLFVGKLFDDVGFLDCGNWVDGDSTECPACQRQGIETVGVYKVCLNCNAGYREEAL